MKLNAARPAPLAVTGLDLLEESSYYQRRQHKFLGISLRDLMLALGVLLLHLFLLSMLSWRSLLYHGAASRAEPSTKAISAYMLSAAQLEAMTKQDLTKQAVPFKNSSETQLSSVVTKEQILFSSPQPKSPGVASPEQQQPQNQKYSRKPSIEQTQVTSSEKGPKETLAIAMGQPDEVSAKGFTFEAPELPGDSALLQDTLYVGEIGAITGKYLARHRQALIDNLVQRAADTATQPKSMNEMDGQMELLALPKVDEYDTAMTLDIQLDPNRIVKVGDTCYRVVKVATPINPHAENLGFPFKCGEDKVKQAIKKSLDRHLELMGVSKKATN